MRETMVQSPSPIRQRTGALTLAAQIRFIAAVVAVLVVVAPRSRAAETKSGFVTTPDGIKIHYLEAGATQTRAKPTVKIRKGVWREADVKLQNGPGLSILFVPGWTMPAWIWQKQIDYFSPAFRVVAMDPRSQGESTITSEGLYPAARARDIKAVIDQLHLAPVVLVGWSMAVTEVAAYVEQFGTDDLAGLVFVDDDFGGLTPAAAQSDIKFINQILTHRQKTVADFIRTVFFKKPQPPGYVDRVIEASLQVSTSDAAALLVGKFAADYRSAAAKIDKPTLFCYAESPYMSPAQQKEIQAGVKDARLEVFHGAGHALFVDDAARFNIVLQDFLTGLP